VKCQVRKKWPKPPESSSQSGSVGSNPIGATEKDPLRKRRVILVGGRHRGTAQVFRSPDPQSRFVGSAVEEVYRHDEREE